MAIRAELPLSLPPDAECDRCAARLCESLTLVRGVQEVEVDPGAGRLRIEYDPEMVPLDRLAALAADVGAGLGARYRHETIEVSGMDCADCARSIERGVAGLPGVNAAAVNFAAGQLAVEYEASALEHGQIVGRVRELGYGVREVAAATGTQVAEASAPARRLPQLNTRALAVGAAAIALAVGFGLDVAGAPREAIAAACALAMGLGGWHVALAGWRALRLSRTLDMNALMTIAAIGAAALGDWLEAGTVVVLFALGNALESYTVDRARGAIRQLMALAPSEARVRRGGSEITLPVAEVRVGDVLRVRPGERIPLDGEVVEGSSAVDEAPITGESVPVDKGLGAAVFAGSVNGEGYLEMRATKPYRETTIARIIRMVEEAQASRAPTQRLVDRFSSRYTPAVIALAALIALVPPLVTGDPFAGWVYRALVLLVIACPCALVISTPVAIVSAITRAARDGILIKGGAHLETLGAVRALAFDKTGTLTLGRPEIAAVEGDVLALAAAVEARSEHPLAKAIVRHAQHAGIEIPAVVGFEALPGKGARGRVITSSLPPLGEGQDEGVSWERTTHEDALTPALSQGERGPVSVAVGAPTWLAAEGVDLAPIQDALAAHEAAGRTALAVAVDGRAAGLIALADRARPGAREAIAALHRAGIGRVAMLTGDNPRTAAALAAEVGIDDARAGLLPDEKVAAVRELIASSGTVAMVGDGVNDAPALAAANVGIAMGVAGSAAALETADVALMADELERVPHAILLAREALGTIRVNVAFSLVTKLIFLILAALGIAGLWLAVLADTGTSLLVTLNGMRLLRKRD